MSTTPEISIEQFPASLTPESTSVVHIKEESEDEHEDYISSASSYSYHTERDDGDDASIGASSTASDEGEYCHRCAFAYDRVNDCFCGCCGVALKPNPCPDSDEQVAAKLQVDEEALAFQLLQEKELKRQSLAQEAILVRSQVLVDDVESFVRMNFPQKDGESGLVVNVDTIQKQSHVILASRFIERADRARTEGGTLEFVYHFTKNAPSRLQQIRQTGLGPYASVSTHVEAAFQNPERYEYAPSLTASERISDAPLFGDEEDDVKGKEKTPASDLLGWIAVIVVDPSDKVPPNLPNSHLPQERTVRIVGSKIKAINQAVVHSDDCLPLAYFEASLRNSDSVAQILMKGFSSICTDFFQACWTFADQREIENGIVAHKDDDDEAAVDAVSPSSSSSDDQIAAVAVSPNSSDSANSHLPLNGQEQGFAGKVSTSTTSISSDSISSANSRLPSDGPEEQGFAGNSRGDCCLCRWARKLSKKVAFFFRRHKKFTRAAG